MPCTRGKNCTMVHAMASAPQRPQNGGAAETARTLQFLLTLCTVEDRKQPHKMTRQLMYDTVLSEICNLHIPPLLLLSLAKEWLCPVIRPSLLSASWPCAFPATSYLAKESVRCSCHGISTVVLRYDGVPPRREDEELRDRCNRHDHSNPKP